MIALGGAAGALARFHMAGAIQRAAGDAFPWGTLGVNMTGSFLLGLLLPSLELHAHDALRAAVTVGFLGAFTTFSTFAHDALLLAERGLQTRAALYAAVSVAAGVTAVAAGMTLAP